MARVNRPGVLDALVTLALAVSAWREAACDGIECIGENHVESCPCEIARQGILAAHDAIGIKVG